MNGHVSVITLTYNKLAYTRKCLTSLLQTAYNPWELIVVENGSTDGTWDWLKTFQWKADKAGVKVTVILNKENVGCSTARNQGIAKARGDLIAFVDNDLALRSKNWLMKLGIVLDADPKAGFVGPKLIYPFPPNDIQFAGGAVSKSGKVQFIGRGEPKGDPRFNTRRDMQFLISACFMTRRTVLDEIGGFDEAFNPVQFEDTDLCYRARSKGYRLVYEPTVEMYHFESVTTDSMPGSQNAAMVVRHGLLFKERWKHMFEKEDGPADEDTKWKKIPRLSVDTVGDLPLV